MPCNLLCHACHTSHIVGLPGTGAILFAAGEECALDEAVQIE